MMNTCLYTYYRYNSAKLRYGKYDLMRTLNMICTLLVHLNYPCMHHGIGTHWGSQSISESEPEMMLLSIMH